MPTIPAKPSFRERLPRLYELKDMVEDAAHPDAYFQNFEDGFAERKSKLAAFLKLERQLAVLDEAAWADLKERAAAVLQKREPGRGWRLLFDVFSEARAYGYLVSIGCTGVRFIPRGKRKTPDLAATLAGEPVFCEVKTINISGEEADKRRRVGDGEMIGGSVSITLPQGFLDKLTATFEHAIGQLDAADPERKAHRFVFAMVHFDDWVGDYQPEYFAQMDAHLRRHPAADAQLVFCPASNLFERNFAMTMATVLPE